MEEDLCGSHSLVSLSQLLHLVSLGLCGSLHRGGELLFRAGDLLILDDDLLLPLHHLDFNLLQTDLLLLLGRLQLVRQLSLCFLKGAEVLHQYLHITHNIWQNKSKPYNSLPSCSLPD